MAYESSDTSLQPPSVGLNEVFDTSMNVTKGGNGQGPLVIERDDRLGPTREHSTRRFY